MESESKTVTELSEIIDKPGCYARNENNQFPMTNLFLGDSRLGCKSDTDEQLIIHVAFRDFVKLHSIKFTEYNGGAEPENHPTIVKVFANRNNIGFEDVDDIIEDQELELDAEDLRESSDPTRLKFVKFQRVKSITLFFEDNAGGEISALGGLKLFGCPLQSMNMNELKKQG